MVTSAEAPVVRWDIVRMCATDCQDRKDLTKILVDRERRWKSTRKSLVCIVEQPGKSILVCMTEGPGR